MLERAADAGAGESGQRYDGWCGSCAQSGRLEHRAARRGCGLARRTAETAAMIPTPSRVWLVVEPIDMRAGIDGLSLRFASKRRCAAAPATALSTPSPIAGATG
jgi:hypothetical protein